MSLIATVVRIILPLVYGAPHYCCHVQATSYLLPIDADDIVFIVSGVTIRKARLPRNVAYRSLRYLFLFFFTYFFYLRHTLTWFYCGNKDTKFILQFLQTMDLANRFEETTAYATVKIGTVDINKLFSIVGAKRMITKYGATVLLSIRESEARIVKLFLPKIYCALISDDDMDKINTKAVSLDLVYKGLCKTSKSYLLGIES